jgi:hypothetical protein
LLCFGFFRGLEMGKGKNLNPADKQRKKDREREKKRNREDKTMLKEIVHLDPDAILQELKGSRIFFFFFFFFFFF